MNTRVEERCGCGASFTINASTATSAQVAVSSWRSSHRHERSEPELQEVDPPYVAHAGSVQVERAPMGFMPHDWKPIVG